jgi:glycosyltransferase involved in cell wall biosynthesis
MPRILHLVAGAKWTGPAAVAIDQVRALRAAGQEAEIAFTARSPLAERFASEGWTRPLFSPSAGPSAFLRDVSALAATLEREPFDLVHCHATHDHLVALAAAPRRGFPLVRSFHHRRTLRSSFWTRWAIRRSAGHVFSNSSIQREFFARYGSEAPARVFSPVVDTALFHGGERDESLLRSFGVPAGSFVVGTVGKVARGRGYEEAVRIFAGVDDPEIVWLQIGKGELLDPIRRRANALGLGSRLFGTGYQEERLPDLYRCMDVFLFTATGSDQGHRAVLEAMASAVPVVSLAIEGLEDARLRQGSGLICGSEQDAAQALVFLRSHPDQRAAMGDFARTVAGAFSPAAFGAPAADFYARALDFWKNRQLRRVTMPLTEKS